MGRARNHIDLTGLRFGRLVVTVDGYHPGCRGALWECRCDCGGTAHVSGSHLKRGVVKSCGCWRDERLVTHGKSKTREYRMWIALRWRANRDGREFDLDPSDIVIPSECPVFKKPFHLGPSRSPMAPSVDRIDNAKGYVRGNIAIISARANAIKRDATAAELEAIAAWLRKALAT